MEVFNFLLLQVITLLHILFILFVVAVPFIGGNYLLMLHTIAIPFLLFHWIYNDNTCFLTTVEKKIRNSLYGEQENDNDCFTCKLIDPIYDVHNNYSNFSKFIYVIVIILWLISVSRLIYKYNTGQINNYTDLFLS